jgi:hypothetical protein
LGKLTFLLNVKIHQADSFNHSGFTPVFVKGPAIQSPHFHEPQVLHEGLSEWLQRQLGVTADDAFLAFALDANLVELVYVSHKTHANKRHHALRTRQGAFDDFIRLQNQDDAWKETFVARKPEIDQWAQTHRPIYVSSLPLKRKVDNRLCLVRCS